MTRSVRPYQYTPLKIDTRELLGDKHVRSSYPLPEIHYHHAQEILHLANRDLEVLNYTVKKLSYLVAPIRRLPSELLARIFKEVCKSEGFTGALIISVVCPRWREVALVYPTLWSSLRIDLDHEDHQTEDWDLPDKKIKELKRMEEVLEAKVELYLERSKELPLDLDITPVSHSWLREHPAFTLLAQQSTRWRSLVFRGQARPLRSLSLPLLRMVGFAERSSRDTLYPPHAESFSHTRGITQLMLNAIEIYPDTLAAFSNSWGSLTSLNYGTKHSLKMLWPILDRCSRLSHLSLQCTDNKAIRVDPSGRCTPPKTLVTITSFSVTFEKLEYGELLDHVFSSLTLPNITSFAVEQDNGPTRGPRLTDPDSVLEFMERSQCRKVTSLKIRDVCFGGAWIVYALLRVPSLQELSITDSSSPTKSTFHPISTKLVKCLHASKRNLMEAWPRAFCGDSAMERLQIAKWSQIGPLVPNLRRLILKTLTTKERYLPDLDMKSSPVFDPVSFIETVTSRWLPDGPNELGVVCLKSVELHLPEGDDPKKYASLERFEAAGMQVVVKCDGREKPVMFVY